MRHKEQHKQSRNVNCSARPVLYLNAAVHLTARQYSHGEVTFGAQATDLPDWTELAAGSLESSEVKMTKWAGLSQERSTSTQTSNLPFTTLPHLIHLSNHQLVTQDKARHVHLTLPLQRHALSSPSFRSHGRLPCWSREHLRSRKGNPS